MDKQVKEIISKLREKGYMNQLEELWDAYQDGDIEVIQEEINCSLELLGLNKKLQNNSKVKTDNTETVEEAINVDDVLFNVIAEGKKVTIIKPNELVPEKYYGVIKSYQIKNWSQYNNCLILTFRAFRKRSDYEIIITPHDTAFILNGNYEECWRKEKIKDKLTELHRLKIDDFEPNKVIMNHVYGKEFTDLWNDLDVEII